MNGIQFEQNVEVSFTSEMDNLRQVDAEHGRFIEVVFRENAKLRAANQFLGFVDVCALERFRKFNMKNLTKVTETFT